MHPATGADELFLAFQQALSGRYSIDRELGRGGMGVVYLAREVYLDRLVAIKLLPPERGRDQRLRERFLREARLAAKLSHPNIVPIHAVEEAAGFVYFVMAFVDGETLTSRVRTRGPLPGAEGARLLREVAWALAYAHGQGVVHRDVKPDNILLESATQRVLVADFGIAAVAGDASDGVSGTPEFMSPEQALGQPLDARSDLYSLGATAFFAFSGRYPFEGRNATEVLAKQVTEAAPALASLGLTVPRKVATLVDRCLAKTPGDRPATAQALAEQLNAALELRRELPAPLRAFVKRYGRMDGSGTMLAMMALLPVSIGVSAVLGALAGFATFAVGAVGAPFAYSVWAARRLRAQGFAWEDLAPAYAAELEQAREELMSGKSRALTRVERALTLYIKGALSLGGLGFALVLFKFYLVPKSLWPALEWLDPVAPLVFASTTLATLILVAVKQRHQDVDTTFWARAWRSAWGRVAFRVARRLLGKNLRQTAVTHRATELSLGLAAEELFEGLPKETRRALGDLPALLKRLQHDAQVIRQRHDELAEALASVGAASGSPEYQELCALRDETQAKLGETVGALETIRLNLLRLHAGSTSVEGVTTHLGIAAEVSEQVERLIAAHADLERHLKFPRSSVATPA